MLDSMYITMHISHKKWNIVLRTIIQIVMGPIPGGIFLGYKVFKLGTKWQ